MNYAEIPPVVGDAQARLAYLGPVKQARAVRQPPLTVHPVLQQTTPTGNQNPNPRNVPVFEIK